MPAPQKPSYAEARRALSRHLYRHHATEVAHGTLAERLSYHDDLHWVFQQRGLSLGHQHGELLEKETTEDVAHRYLREGEEGAASDG